MGARAWDPDETPMRQCVGVADSSHERESHPLRHEYVRNRFTFKASDATHLFLGRGMHHPLRLRIPVHDDLVSNAGWNAAFAECFLQSDLCREARAVHGKDIYRSRAQLVG